MQYHLESIKQTNPEMLKGKTAVQCSRFASHLHSESQLCVSLCRKNMNRRQQMTSKCLEG